MRTEEERLRHNARELERYRANRDAIRAADRAKYAADPARQARARAKTEQWRIENPERYRQTKLNNRARARVRARERYRAMTKEERRERSLRYEKRDAGAIKAKKRADHFKSLYGLTVADHAAMVLDQGGCCALCGDRFSDKPAQVHVDHDHRTGRVRGILCHHCNRGLGCFMDSPLKLALAIKYLQTSAAA